MGKDLVPHFRFRSRIAPILRFCPVKGGWSISSPPVRPGTRWDGAETEGQLIRQWHVRGCMNNLSAQIPNLNQSWKTVYRYQIGIRSMNSLHQQHLPIGRRFRPPGDSRFAEIGHFSFQIHEDHLRCEMIIKKFFIMRRFQEILIGSGRRLFAQILLDHGAFRHCTPGWGRTSSRRNCESHQSFAIR